MNAINLTAIRCGDCPIRHRAVCSRCNDDELTLLENMKSYKSFAAGEVILWRGEPLDYVASIVDGVASLSKTMEDGRTQMVGLMLPSDFIGRPGRTKVAFDVTATTDVTLCRFERKSFERLVVNTPHLAQRLMEIALDELDAARDWMVLLGRKTAREKIATFIDMLALRSLAGASKNDVQIELPMTRNQIADYLGLTLETVSRHINALKKKGIITLSGRKSITVANISALRSATGDDADSEASS
jgi:CRP/FNR family transcriptional regulator|tara:strand:+ start:406 stop:1137 length:732 start_codon:yes stop_codon:yes gene_type:complete